jgi:hypothetical protein
VYRRVWPGHLASLAVRPPRDDIAAPELPGRIHWLNTGEPPRMSELTATAPVLVHFFDFAQLNSVRALPYVLEWHRRYAPHGLRVLGIHSPRFRFSGEREVATAGVGTLGIEHPVALDSDYTIWHDYGCKGWPSLFLWAPGGALAWVHFGEGEYRATEEAIQELLRAENVTMELPDPMEPLRATDAPGALVAPPSEEVFPGGSPAEGWEPGPAGERFELEYEAGGAFLVAEGAGELRASIDGGEPRTLAGTGLHEVAQHPRHERHRLALEASPGVRVWAISFAPGSP